MKSVVVTGVSSGIGYGVAKALIGRGYRVFGSVRREADAERLEAQLGERFAPLVFDVTDREAVLRAAEEVGGVLGTGGLAGLVNNAGVAIAGPLMHQPLEEVRTHFEVNVFGLISTTQAFLPLLGATRTRTHPPGRVVNISSVGGSVGQPFIGAYVGTKHAVEGVSDSLRRELLPYGIDVIVIRPGAVKTEIWGKAAEPGVEAYADTEYAGPLADFQEYAANLAKGGYTPEEFGKRVADAFEARRPKTRYAIVPGRLTGWTIPTLLPDRLLDRIIGRSVGLLRR
jgi:NAD(P)-dependent dehydrogenase (short-subunit alcohol dehydrogenase family)